MKKLTFLILLLSLFSFSYAETRDSEYALFKRTISPAMLWGEDALMLVPKANTMGRGNVYLSTQVINAGKIQNDRIFLTTATAMVSTSDDVEFGYSKRLFVWDNLDFSKIKMDTFHLKARIFHLTDNYIPQIALGVNLISLKGNDYSNSADIMYNPYVAITIRAPLGTEKAVLSITGVADKVYNEGESTDVRFSGGADLKLFNHFYLIGEIQGVNKDGKGGVVNLGAKIRIWWFSIGAGMFNLNKEDLSGSNGSYWMAHIGFDIPFDRLFK
jgi:hypothetical protein